MMTDIHFLIIEEHAIDGFDGTLSGLSSFIMDEAISLGAALFVGDNFAGQDVAKGDKRIMESLDGLTCK